MSKESELLFVLGGPKTASTALCGLLNSHPDIFVMCEVFLNRSLPSRYGKKLLRHSPGLQPFFLREFGTDWLANYRCAQSWLGERGYARRYFGDKFVDIETGFSETMGDTRVIYSVRRLPEWVAKGAVRVWYPLDANLVPYSVQYTKHFVESFLLPRVTYVRMDDFLGTNDALVDGLWSFLELDAPSDKTPWWETIGRYPAEDPKIAVNWWKGHMSSAVSPQSNDTRVELKETAFWSDILPLFDKYYAAAAEGLRMPRAVVVADLRYLDGLIGKYSFSVAESYIALETEARGKVMKAKFERKQRLKKALGFLSFGRKRRRGPAC